MRSWTHDELQRVAAPERAATLGALMRRSLLVLVAAALAWPGSATPRAAAEPVIRAGASAAGLDIGNLTFSQAEARSTVRGPARPAGRGARRGPSSRAEPRVDRLCVRSAQDRAARVSRGNHPGGAAGRRTPCTRRTTAKKLAAFTVACRPRDPDHAAQREPADHAAADAPALPVWVGRSTSRRSHRRLTAPRRPFRVPPLRAPKRAGVTPPSMPDEGPAQAATRTVITIDSTHFKLRLFKGLKLHKSYGIAVGMPASRRDRPVHPSPTRPSPARGRRPNSPWAGALPQRDRRRRLAENPLKARWMGIVSGVGIHGTGEPGSIGSARVARLHPHDGARRDRPLSARAGRHAGAASAEHRRCPSDQTMWASDRLRRPTPRRCCACSSPATSPTSATPTSRSRTCTPTGTRPGWTWRAMRWVVDRRTAARSSPPALLLADDALVYVHPDAVRARASVPPCASG